MKFLALPLALVFFAGTIEATTQVENSPVQFSFDDRAWEQGFTANTPDSSITEYVLKGENVDGWSELVTVQTLPALNISPQQFAEAFLGELKRSVEPTEVQSKIIDQTDKTILLEWWIATGPNAQHEWLKLIMTPQKTLALRYTTKKAEDVEKVRAAWEKILQNAQAAQ